MEAALGVAGLTSFVLMLSTIASFMIDNWLLIPLHIEYLKTVFFIFIILVIVQLVNMYIEKNKPLLHRSVGNFLPLISTNSAVIGVVIRANSGDYNFIEVTLYSLGASIGFALILISFSAMREKITAADVPQPFKGTSIFLITAGLTSLAFMGFIGIV
jgi:electron transport complex protein RnfA|tara:strand:- start:2440 stop:2913 length:474 start_codon:yes stop_codon:yes gene_type:complete